MTQDSRYTELLDFTEQAISKREELGETNTYGKLFNAFAFSRARWVGDFLYNKLGNTVIDGPLEGLKVLETTREGCFIPKLLGCYEEELHPFLETVQNTNYKRVINIGSADGYYILGIGRLLPDAELHGYDINTEMHQYLARMATLNNMEGRVQQFAECSPATLEETIVENTLIWCDCEGCEYGVLDPVKAPKLKHADIVVEVHGGQNNPARQEEFLNRFKDTHDVHLVQHQGRNPNQYPIVSELKDLDKWLCVWEFRGENTPWMVATRK